MIQSSFLTRRTVLGAALLPVMLGRAEADMKESFRAIEKSTGGRMGVAVLDTETGKQIGWRENERFAMCSTFKFMAVSAILKRGGGNIASLNRFIKYGPGDFMAYAPITKAHVKEGGMTLGALCAAAIEWSDNTAANLILKELGGPPAVTAFARSLGDTVTRLDRIEPDLNTAIAGDPRDTTAPRATLGDMEKLLIGDALPETVRGLLTQWMLDCKTAEGRIRAGLPKSWRIGSKTGTGGNSTHNEIAITWPPGKNPILIASYLTTARVPDARCNAAHANVARLIVKSL